VRKKIHIGMKKKLIVQTEVTILLVLLLVAILKIRKSGRLEHQIVHLGVHKIIGKHKKIVFKGEKGPPAEQGNGVGGHEEVLVGLVANVPLDK